jgi:hypothetical protein
VTGRLRELADAHVTVAPVAMPVLFTSASGVVRDMPVPVFQFVTGTTPALSAAPIAVPVPTKSMLMTDAKDDETTSVVEAERASTPLVPVIASVETPNWVSGDVVTVRVDVPDPPSTPGENDAVAPSGSPLTPSSTSPPNPFAGVIVTE